jgi:CheY-like chemotaxis protein
MKDGGIEIDHRYREKSLAHSSGSIITLNVAEQESDPPSASEWPSDTAGGYASNALSRCTHDKSSQKRLNLLLAEDNLPDALLVREAIQIQNLPFEVFAASDGQAAIDFIVAAEENPEAPCPEFLVLDLNLPRRDGFEVLRSLRESKKCKNIPVLVITSSDSAAHQRMAAELGAGYFRKPPSYEGFLRVGEVLKGMLEHR